MIARAGDPYGREVGQDAEVMPARRSSAGGGRQIKSGLGEWGQGCLWKQHMAEGEGSVLRAALSAHGKDPQDRQGPGKIPVGHVSSMSVFLLKLMIY